MKEITCFLILLRKHKLPGIIMNQKQPADLKFEINIAMFSFLYHANTLYSYYHYWNFLKIFWISPKLRISFLALCVPLWLYLDFVALNGILTHSLTFQGFHDLVALNFTCLVSLSFCVINCLFISVYLGQFRIFYFEYSVMILIKPCVVCIWCYIVLDLNRVIRPNTSWKVAKYPLSIALKITTIPNHALDICLHNITLLHSGQNSRKST